MPVVHSAAYSLWFFQSRLAKVRGAATKTCSSDMERNFDMSNPQCVAEERWTDQDVPPLAGQRKDGITASALVPTR